MCNEFAKACTRRIRCFPAKAGAAITRRHRDHRGERPEAPGAAALADDDLGAGGVLVEVDPHTHLLGEPERLLDEGLHDL